PAAAGVGIARWVLRDALLAGLVNHPPPVGHRRQQVSRGGLAGLLLAAAHFGGRHLRGFFQIFSQALEHLRAPPVEAGRIAYTTAFDLARAEPEAAGRILLLELLADIGQLPRRAWRGLTGIATRILDALLQFAEALLDLAPLLRQAFQVLETHARRGLLLP